mmetsp:Transcript_18355/g.30611  ORF Transcript_18355/g.30611 Transcript_18355/m.30611 type:complete len:344 (-) Transcript_18355:218-1249(-)
MKISQVCLVLSAIVAGASGFQMPAGHRATITRMHSTTAVAATSQKFYQDGKVYQDLDESGNPVKTYIYNREGECIQTLDANGDPDTEFFKKFGKFKGQKVRTVAETLQQFYTTFTKPIFPQFRNIVSEILVSTHLAVVTPMFTYDPVFASGLKTMWEQFMGSYPLPEQLSEMYTAMINSLGFEVDTVAADEVKLDTFLEGKTGADVLAVMKGEADDAFFGPIFKEIRENKWFWYSRPFGAGMFKMMLATGTELTEANVEEWVAVLGFNKSMPLQDLKIYTDSLQKLKEAEKMYKEVEIREKKAMAKRLEEKADRAIKAAEKKAKEAEAAAATASADATESVEA